MPSNVEPPKLDWNEVLGPCASEFSAPELRELESSLQRHPDRCVRLADATLTLPFSSEPVPWSRIGRFVPSDVLPGSLLQYAAGDYYIQDAGSLLALELCELKGHERVLDACAAPGGKSTGILERLNLQGQEGFLVANEVIASRLPQLKLACQRTGADNYVITHREIEQLAPLFLDAFDCVLIDAPCSGQSMVMRGKQSWSSFSIQQIEHNAARQAKILEQAARLVKPGGRLVYSTCTFSFLENERALIHFLNHQSEWTCHPVPHLRSWESPELVGSYRLWPHRDRCAGAFAAALKRNGEDGSPSHEDEAPPNHAKKRGSKSKHWKSVQSNSLLDELPFFEFSLDASPSKNTEAVRGLSLERHWQFEHKSGDRSLAGAQVPLAWLEQAYAYPVLATSKGPRWEPSFESAKRSSTPRPRFALELTDEGARQYVLGEAVKLSNSTCIGAPSASDISRAKGWVLMAWRGRALGWGKISNSVAKKPLSQAIATRCANVALAHEQRDCRNRFGSDSRQQSKTVKSASYRTDSSCLGSTMPKRLDDKM